MVCGAWSTTKLPVAALVELVAAPSRIPPRLGPDRNQEWSSWLPRLEFRLASGLTVTKNMPRTKVPHGRPRQSSHLHGADTEKEEIKHLERQVKELQRTLKEAIATTEENASRICHEVDLWYDNIIRTVPEEVLNRPYRENWDSLVQNPPPHMSVASTTLKSSCGPSALASTCAESEASTSNQLGYTTETKVAATIEAKKEESETHPTTSNLPEAQFEKSLGSPIAEVQDGGHAPGIRAKFDITKKPANARKARPGEILLSLKGSPVSTKPAEVVLCVHLDETDEIQRSAGEITDESVKDLCKAIEKLYEDL
ncbi:uncharacterized protein [Dermacentor albipictus]|uniref:uncharacterized protein isoform X2 n=1 Tax=Dermacentor albipictus TaxID=60249 RepID=UPI0031FDEA16